MSTTRQRVYAAARVLIVLALLGYVVSILASQWDDVRAISAPSPAWIGVSALAMMAYYALIMENWRVVMGAVGAPLSRRQAFHFIYVSNLAKFLPGGVWNLLGRVAMCREHGIAVAKTSVAVVVEQVSHTCAIGVTAVVLLSSQADSVLPVSRWVLAPGIVLLLLGIHPRVINFVLGILARVTKREVPLLEVSYGFILWTLARYLLAWQLLWIAFVLMGQALLGRSAQLADVLMLAGSLSFGWFTGLVAFFLPSGLGVRDVLLVSLLKIGFSAGYAAALALAFRVWHVLLELILFAIAVAVGKGAAEPPAP